MVTQERHGSCHLQIQQGCEFYAGTPGANIADEELGGNPNVLTFWRNTLIVPDSNRFLRGSVGDDPRGFSLRYLANLRWPSYRKRKNA
jgi:hypothetical protein